MIAPNWTLLLCLHHRGRGWIICTPSVALVEVKSGAVFRTRHGLPSPPGGERLKCQATARKQMTDRQKKAYRLRPAATVHIWEETDSNWGGDGFAKTRTESEDEINLSSLMH